MAQEQAKLNLLARVYPIPKPVPLDADPQQELSFQIALGLGSGGSLAHHLRGLQPSLAPDHPGQLLLRGLAEMRLSPVDPFLFGMQQGSASAHFFAGRYDEALTWAKMATLSCHIYLEFLWCLLHCGYDPTVGTLKDPQRDVRLVGSALAKQGFEVLAAILDARRSEILGAVRNLVRRLNGAGPNAIGFVYYSGHGAAEKDTNVNYLIPVDAREPGTAQFWDES
jgi:Caspase domain